MPGWEEGYAGRVVENAAECLGVELDLLIELDLVVEWLAGGIDRKAFLRLRSVNKKRKKGSI